MNNYNNFDYQTLRGYSNMRQVSTNNAKATIPQVPSIPDIPIDTQDLATPYVAYTRGNLFNLLYEQYKNYKPAVLDPRSEREDLLLTINQLTFSARELNIFLDTHPNDLNMLTLFNKYRELADTAIHEYEKKYGPFTISSDYMNEIPFNWVADPWPWEWEGDV